MLSYYRNKPTLVGENETTMSFAHMGEKQISLKFESSKTYNTIIALFGLIDSSSLQIKTYLN